MNPKYNKENLFEILNQENLTTEEVVLIDNTLDGQFGIPDNRSIDGLNYQELSNQALLTSYFDYWKIFENLPPNSILLDLGAGFCRGTLLANLLELKIRCISIELGEARLLPAKEYLPGAQQDLIQADIFDIKFNLPPNIDALFLYLPAGKMFNQILYLLGQYNRAIKVFVIESHGQMIPHLDLFPSLFINKKSIDKTAVERLDGNIYCYDYIPQEECTPMENYYLEIAEASLNDKWELQVKDEMGIWITAARDCEFFLDKDEVLIETIRPHRLINLATSKVALFPKSKFCKWFEEQPPYVVKLYINPSALELIDGNIVPGPKK